MSESTKRQPLQMTHGQLLDYCRELEAALVTADKAHVDQGTKLATLKAAVLADPIKTPAYRRRIALLEAALDWIHNKYAGHMEDGPYDPPPPHLAAILEASRKRINGSDKDMSVYGVSQADYDALAQQLAEANRKLKNYEPIALYNGKGIEQYAAELTACKASLSEAREQNERLMTQVSNAVGWKTALEKIANGAATRKNFSPKQIAALALKPSDAKEGTP